MVYDKNPHNYYHNFTPKQKIVERLENFEKVVIPEIQNTAFLLKEVSEFLNIPVEEVCEITILDNDPCGEQIYEVIHGLQKILSDNENIKKLQKYPNALYLGAFIADSRKYEEYIVNYRF